MKSSVALGWRLLLAFALIANPLAAAAMPCHDEAAATPVAPEAPPCHEDEAPAASEASEPTGAHDCAGCDFASCCANGLPAAVGVPPAASLPAHDFGHAQGARALAAPPLPPLIRPPIA